mmetsp:Transcript_57111/g.99868  ORF Transcript_57111/g.99868 Transcript_57111/m.99868 type:complete len:328 (-) Transcript_57111:50-1033(-)
MTANFSASSWTQVTLTLCSVEKEIGVIRLKADERVAKEAERVKMVARKRQESIDEHLQHVAERDSEYKNQLENIQSMADREITELEFAKDQAVIRIKTAEQCALKAEATAKELEKEVKALYALYDKACVEWEDRLAEVRNTADERVSQKLEESNQLIRDTGIYASEVQAGSLSAVATMEAGTRARIADLDSESLQRSRYRELKDVAISHSHREIPETQFHSAKNSMIQDWHDQWTGHVSSPVVGNSPTLQGSLAKFTDASIGGTRQLGSPILRDQSPEDILDRVMNRAAQCPSPPDVLRSKDKAMSRASDDQRSRHERQQLRPLTAG